MAVILLSLAGGWTGSCTTVSAPLEKAVWMDVNEGKGVVWSAPGGRRMEFGSGDKVS